MAYITQDGSITDRAGKVIFLSTQRFVDDICLGNCCFICGAKPEDKPFNLNPAVDLETVTGFAAPYNQGERLKPVRGAAADRVYGP
jgi:hypothetical protein